MRRFRGQICFTTAAAALVSLLTLRVIAIANEYVVTNSEVQQRIYPMSLKVGEIEIGINYRLQWVISKFGEYHENYSE